VPALGAAGGFSWRPKHMLSLSMSNLGQTFAGSRSENTVLTVCWWVRGAHGSGGSGMDALGARRPYWTVW
jgi:hypothetical protein